MFNYACMSGHNWLSALLSSTNLKELLRGNIASVYIVEVGLTMAVHKEHLHRYSQYIQAIENRIIGYGSMRYALNFDPAMMHNNIILATVTMQSWSLNKQP